MPVDPKTGQPLPYPGEPGYEEAITANPDAYAQAVGPEADAGMPPEAGMPPAAGAPAPADLRALEEEEAMLEQDIMSQAAPAPEKPFSMDAIQTMLTEFNKTLDTFAGEDIPDLTWDAGEGGGKWDQPLPPEVFAPLVALNESLKLVEGGEYFDKYGIELEALTSDAELRKATASIKKMGKDKKLVEAMQAPVGPVEGGGGMPPAPGAFDEEEQMLAANMG